MRAGSLCGFGLALWILALPSYALDLNLPYNAKQTAARDSVFDEVSIPVGPFKDGALEDLQFEGRVTRRAYRINVPGLTTLQMLSPLRDQIDAAGYEILLDCNQISCGGYDFRFNIEVLPAPNMYVNIRAFRFLTALDPRGQSAITLLVSAADSASYIQIMQVGVLTKSLELISATPQEIAPETPLGGIASQLAAHGHYVLSGINFAVGTTSLSDAPAPELAALADLLSERPKLKLAIVGHTDTSGGLEANIAVSQERAQSVRLRLIEQHAVDPTRVDAQGMGYLAPRASNRTEAGRTVNRRVEVIIVNEEG